MNKDQFIKAIIDIDTTIPEKDFNLLIRSTIDKIASPYTRGYLTSRYDIYYNCTQRDYIGKFLVWANEDIWKDEWLFVSDKLPDDYEIVLAKNNSKFCLVCEHSNGVFRETLDDKEFKYVVQWKKIN